MWRLSDCVYIEIDINSIQTSAIINAWNASSSSSPSSFSYGFCWSIFFSFVSTFYPCRTESECIQYYNWNFRQLEWLVKIKRSNIFDLGSLHNFLLLLLFFIEQTRNSLLSFGRIVFFISYFLFACMFVCFSRRLAPKVSLCWFSCAYYFDVIIYSSIILAWHKMNPLFFSLSTNAFFQPHSNSPVSNCFGHWP